MSKQLEKELAKKKLEKENQTLIDNLKSKNKKEKSKVGEKNQDKIE
jgi:hypothetical protein